jgi:hypothetical protein
VTLHNLGEMGFLGVKTDLFGHPLPFHPQFTHEKPSKSIAYTHVGEMGEMGEFTPAIVGEMGESPIGLTNSPTPTQAQEADTESVVKQPTEIIVSNVIQSQVEQSDEALTFARQLRTRFADCRLTYHAIGDVVRGKRPYWWAEVAR